MFLKFAHWRYAKTMPKIPHYYIMPQYLKTEEDKVLFWRAVDFIESNGFYEEFYYKKYKNMNIGPHHRVWLMPEKKDKNIINCRSRYAPPHIRPSDYYIYPDLKTYTDIVRNWDALRFKPRENIWRAPKGVAF